ncbi:MAG: response regulator, partial [Proteobacteria bacterium]|nr:response regulator [Pseudomonadota bacterium]
SNAAEAIYEAGKITISTENLYIDRPVSGYDYVEEGDYVALIVSDTGAGISDEDIGKIFEPFYTEKKMGRSGTGLGMAVVWGTVKDHNGYIDIQSTPGNGTTFILYFPITRQKPAENDTSFSIQNYMSKGESILVVDDVKQQREIASTILKELGYSVATVSSGEKAVEYLSNNSVDLLVLDMIMEPGIDGLDTYKQILKLHSRQKAIIT